DPGATLRRTWLWPAARLLRTGCDGRSSGLAAIKAAAVSRRTGCGRDCCIRGYDFYCRSRESILATGSGDGCGRRGMDRDSGLPEYGGTDHVAIMDSRAGPLHVFARSAGWNGHREYTLGCSSDTPGIGEYNGVLGSGVAAGAGNDPETPIEREVPGTSP